MEEQKTSYQTFEDLDAYKIAREFREARSRTPEGSSRVAENVLDYPAIDDEGFHASSL